MSANPSAEILTAEQIATATIRLEQGNITFDDLAVGRIYLEQGSNFYRVKSKGAKFATLERLAKAVATRDLTFSAHRDVVGYYQMTEVKLCYPYIVEDTLKMVYNIKFGSGKDYDFMDTPPLQRFGHSLHYYEGRFKAPKLERLNNNQVRLYTGRGGVVFGDFRQFSTVRPSEFYGLYTRPFEQRHNPSATEKWREYIEGIAQRRQEDPTFFDRLEAWYNTTSAQIEAERREHQELCDVYETFHRDFRHSYALGLANFYIKSIEEKRTFIAEYQPIFQVWEAQKIQLSVLLRHEHNEVMARSIPSHNRFRQGRVEMRAEFVAQLQAFHDETVRQQDEQVALARERRRQEELERLGSYITPEAPEEREARLLVAPEAVRVNAVAQVAPEVEAVVVVAQVAPEEPPNGW